MVKLNVIRQDLCCKNSHRSLVSIIKKLSHQWLSSHHWCYAQHGSKVRPSTTSDGRQDGIS